MEKQRCFRSKLFNLFLIAIILFGYNQMLEKKDLQAALKASDEQLDHMEELLSQAAQSGQMAEISDGGSAAGYQDGTYEGTGTGFGGDITVSVKVLDGKITKVELVSAPKEDEAYLNTAKKVLDNITKAQTAEVDTISGATFSSTGMIEAAKAALTEAAK